MEWDWKWIVVSIVALLIGRFAFGVTFHLNDYLKRRDGKLRNQLQNACSHAELVMVDGRPGVKSLMESPSGTLNWYCKRCGYKSMNEPEEPDLQYWAVHLGDYKKSMKKYDKILKKLGVVP